MDMLERAMRMTPGPALGVIPDVAAYVASRRPEIAAALRDEGATGELVDLAEAQLRAFETDELAFVILSVDINDSTNLQTSTDRQTFAATIRQVIYAASWNQTLSKRWVGTTGCRARNTPSKFRAQQRRAPSTVLRPRRCGST